MKNDVDFYCLNSNYNHVRDRIEPWMNAKQLIGELKARGETTAGAEMILWDLLEHRLPLFLQKTTAPILLGLVGTLFFCWQLDQLSQHHMAYYGYFCISFYLGIFGYGAYLRLRLLCISRLLKNVRIEKARLVEKYRVT